MQKIQFPKMEETPKKKTAPTQDHDLANQFYDYFKGEKWGMFMGLIKRRGTTWAYQKLSDIKEYESRNEGKKYPIEFLMKP